VEFKDGGRNIVVSRRAILEEERRASADQVRRSIEVGAIVSGRVVSVRDFGAFVDLGSGVQGLLHVSEMGWSRIADPSSMVKVGDEITVKVLRIDDDRQKIALGLKQLTPEPAPATEGADEVREFNEREHIAAEGFGSLADKLRGALESKPKTRGKTEEEDIR
jgi:small subunit ribosomal protein S1